MKSKKLKTLLQGVALGACLSPCAVTYAAQQEMLWGKADDYSPSLTKFTVGEASSPTKKLQFAPNYGPRKNSAQTLQFDVGTIDTAKTSHVRYNQYYKQLPVWQSQVIYHVSKSDTEVTGSLIEGVEQDVKDLNGKMSVDEIKQIALKENAVTTPMPVNVEKIIYFNNDMSSKAILAYHASYILSTSNEKTLPSFIIDATTGDILEKWNALPNITNGMGLGGVSVDRPGTRLGKYQFGNSVPGLNQFGPLPVKDVGNGICIISNPKFKVMNLKNLSEQQLGFGLPVSTLDESAHQLVPFAYYCSSPNLNDNGYAPVNDGISPVNDVTYFVRHTINMLNKKYGLVAPIGTQLPLRIYTHIGNYDNAFACGPHCMKSSGIIGPQQLVFGNGAILFSPLTEGDVVSHEFGHLVTDQFSNLIYSGQSGGINEAFSDMTGMAFNSYLRNIGFTWYWDGKDWTTGKSINKANKPTRSLSNPTIDGNSIDHASNFRPGMNPHFSSGVYNKAFYLLSTTTGWTVEKAYQVMLDANMNYWTAITDYNNGACGVRAAAIARGYSGVDVANAFSQVGVKCPH